MCIISATVANSHHRAPPFEFADKGMKKVLKECYNSTGFYSLWVEIGLSYVDKVTIVVEVMQ
jgi:hypothetical protein